MLRIITILLLCFIVVNLVAGLYHILRKSEDSTRAVRALTWRVVFSVLLFVLIVVLATSGILPE
ncbi:MAG: twin transmembrane helix small protein [Gammaproteobacteria bacterium]